MSLQSVANPTLGSVSTYGAVTQQTAASFTSFGYGWSASISRGLRGSRHSGIAIAAISQVSNRDVLQNAHVTYPDSRRRPTAPSDDGAKWLRWVQRTPCSGIRIESIRLAPLGELPTSAPNMEVPTDIISAPR